ncbi:hypothetical protein FRC09_010376 [Ceratobasidium sp. 395]|nr:hypothetical protein FRC09_010376 [Ceratobasidium sp. 395]
MKYNAAKSEVLLKAFFPKPPEEDDSPGPAAPSPVRDLPELSLEDVLDAIQSLKPHKAPGPDEIPACVYKAGANLLAPFLLKVYQNLPDGLEALLHGCTPETGETRLHGGQGIQAHRAPERHRQNLVLLHR